MPMKSRTFPKPHIPDYLIYDEIKRRREHDAWRPDYLELPLYRPEIPTPKNPVEKYEDPTPSRRDDTPKERDEPKGDRGVMIIDMNDMFEDEDDEDQ